MMMTFLLAGCGNSNAETEPVEEVPEATVEEQTDTEENEGKEETAQVTEEETVAEDGHG